MPMYRNPNNDPPQVGEMVHYVIYGDVEVPGVVNEVGLSGRCGACLFFVGDPEQRSLHYEEYDPTPEPDLRTWHFDWRNM